MVEEWRLLETGWSRPFFNLAVEEAVLNAVGSGVSASTVRLWLNAKSVVLGRYQRPELEVDFGTCKKYDVVLTRRSTGGGAVYHDAGNLNYSIYLSRTHPLAHNCVLRMFHQTSEAVIRGLRKLNIRTLYKAPNTILLEGKKVSGMAGAIKRDGILVHGTLLVDADLEVLREVLRQPQAGCANLSKSVRSVPAEVANINEFHGGVTLAEVRNALRRGFEETFKVELREAALTDTEETLAENLVRIKYCRAEWILEGLAE